MSKRSIADDPADEQEHGQIMPTRIITPEQWSEQRERIKQLYLTDNVSREEIPSIMEEVFGFKASVVQYKYQIRKWQLRKTLTPEEKEFIVLAGHWRQRKFGRSTAFSLSGCVIQDAKVSRQRKGILEDNRDDLKPEECPPDILFWTPPGTPPTSPSLKPKSAKREYRYPIAYRPLCVTCAKCDLDIYGISYERYEIAEYSNDTLCNFLIHLEESHNSSLPERSALQGQDLEEPNAVRMYGALFFNYFEDSDSVDFGDTDSVDFSDPDVVVPKELESLALVKSLNTVSHLQRTHIGKMQIVANNEVFGTLTACPERTSEERLRAIRSSIASRKFRQTPSVPMGLLDSNSAPTETRSGEAYESQGQPRKVSKRQRIDPDIQEQPTERTHANPQNFFRSSVQSRSGVDDDAFADRTVVENTAQYPNTLKLPHVPGLPRTISEICMDELYNVV